MEASNFEGNVEVVPFNSLEPQWHVPGAKEGGYLRYLTSWVGGPQGFVNPNFGNGALESQDLVTGYMRIMTGCRQKGTHAHTIVEIYVILKGEIEGYDGTDETHRAGPMDLVYIPKGVPHGVRNCGTDDLEFLWIHDGIEVKGASTYFYSKEETPRVGGVKVVPWNTLEPHWAAPQASQAPFLRFAMSYVGGKGGFINLNPEQAIQSEATALGMTVIYPGNRQPTLSVAGKVCYIVVDGEAQLVWGKKKKPEQTLRRLDAIWVHEHTSFALHNRSDRLLWICWVMETPQKTDSVKYLS